MDFVKHLMPQRSEGFFLRFSKLSTVAWAVALIVLAYMSKKVEFVLNAAFALRGLTSGALLGGLALAVFWRKGRAMPVVFAMLVSLVVMAAIQFLPQLDSVQEVWKRTFKTEIIDVFWPWYTLIGLTVTLVTAWATRRLTTREKDGV
jgi:Na+/proline symporter